MRYSKRLAAVIAVATGMVGALLAVSVAMAGEPDPVRYPDYYPEATVIKCPFIPEGLVELPWCGGREATCVGTDGNDVIIGSVEDDVIVAGDGDDVVHADAGDDVVCGGPGNDSLMGARGDDIMYGEEGSDWLFGARGKDTLDGGPGDHDVLWGGPDFDNLDGGPGNGDVCMLQREIGDFDAEGCNTVYPPPSYVHEDEPKPGMLKVGKDALKLSKDSGS
jgi:hypothetical protein